MTLYWAALGMGFLFSFAHCLGMCGGIVAAYSGLLPASERSDPRPHLLYSLGRTFSYSLIGLVAGSLGSMVAVGARLAGFQGALSIASGGVMVLLAATMLLGHLRLPWKVPSPADQPWFRRIFHSTMQQPRWWTPGAIGVLNGLLPCGLVYSGTALAASSGSPAGGMVVMACFGLGTTPAMLALGMLTFRLGVPLRRRLQQTAGVVMLIAGALTIARGWPL